MPSVSIRFCTGFLKRDRIEAFARHRLGLKHWHSVVGLRADEPRRVQRMRAEDCGSRTGAHAVLPLADAGVAERDVLGWWRRQPFDLALPGYAGNCTLCFLKGRGKLLHLIREDPALADWWIAQERAVAGRTGPDGRACESMKRFRLGETYEALDIAARTTPDRPPVRSNDTDFARANVGEKFLAGDRAAHPLDWLDRPGAEAFASLRAMDDRHKRQLFASCVARTLKRQLAFEPSARPEVEATVARLDLDLASAVRSHHTPVWSAPLLWNRLPKARLLDIARSTLGDAWAAAHTKRKKAEIAQAMEAAFNSRVEAPGDVALEARAAALAWVPPGFRAFDTGRTAEETPAGDATAGSPTESPPTPDAGQDADIPTGGAGETSPENGTDAPAPIKSLDAPGGSDVGALRPGAGTGHGPGWTPPGPGDSGDPQALPAFPRHSA